MKKQKNNEVIFRLLVEHGASLIAVTTRNMAVLHEAVEAGKLEMVQLILSFPDSIKAIEMAEPGWCMCFPSSSFLLTSA